MQLHLISFGSVDLATLNSGGGGATTSTFNQVGRHSRPASPFVPSAATFAAAGMPLATPMQAGVVGKEISQVVDIQEVDKHVEQLMNAMSLRNSLRAHSAQVEVKERRASMEADPLFAEKEEVRTLLTDRQYTLVHMHCSKSRGYAAGRV